MDREPAVIAAAITTAILAVIEVLSSIGIGISDGVVNAVETAAPLVLVPLLGWFIRGRVSPTVAVERTV